MPPFAKVKSGDKFKIPAADWNGAMEAAEDFWTSRLNKIGNEKSLSFPSAGLAKVCFTDTEAVTTLKKNEIVILGDAFFPNTAPEFFSIPSFKCSDVGSSIDGKKFGILLSELEHTGTDNGTVAFAMMSGVVSCKVKKIHADHKFARLLASDSTQLESAYYGPAEIKWMESGSLNATLNAYVHLGHEQPFEIGIGKLDSGLSVGGSITVSVWYWNGSAFADRGDNITVRDWLMKSGASTISLGKKCIWMRLDAIYIFLEIECD